MTTTEGATAETDRVWQRNLERKLDAANELVADLEIEVSDRDRKIAELEARLDRIEEDDKRCPVHGDEVHGAEAEELRAGLERILDDHDFTVDGEDACSDLRGLLDEVDARDSLAFKERTEDPLKKRIAELEAECEAMRGADRDLRAAANRIRELESQLAAVKARFGVRSVAVPIIVTNADDEAEVDALMNRKATAVRKPLKPCGEGMPGCPCDVEKSDEFQIFTHNKYSREHPELVPAPEPAKPVEPAQVFPVYGDRVVVRFGDKLHEAVFLSYAGKRDALVEMSTQHEPYNEQIARKNIVRVLGPNELLAADQTTAVEPAQDGKERRYGAGKVTLSSLLADPHQHCGAHAIYDLAEHLSRVLAGVAEVGKEMERRASAYHQRGDIVGYAALGDLSAKLRAL